MPTPRSKAPRFLLYSLLLIVAAITGYGIWCFASVRDLREDADALLARASKGHAPARVDPDAAGLHAEIAEIDRWLEDQAPSSEGIASPVHWDDAPEAIDATLERLEPFFERVDDLLARPEAAVSNAKDGVRSPADTRLASARNWTNLLCLRAMHDRRHGEWDAAARRVAQAFALARLRADGTMLGTSIRVSCESIAIGALRRIATTTDADVVSLRRVVEPELRCAAAPAQVLAAVSGEVSRWIEEGRTIPTGWRSKCAWFVRPYHFDWARRELDAYGEIVDEALRQASGRSSGPLDLDGHLKTERTTIENEAFGTRTCLEISLLARSRAQIARAMLALLEHRQVHGRWPSTLAELAFPADPPRDPCSGDPFPYSLTADGADLGPSRFAAVREFDRAQATGLLLDWTLSPSAP